MRQNVILLHAAVHFFCTNFTFVTYTRIYGVTQSVSLSAPVFLSLVVVEVQLEPLGGEAVRQEDGEARLLDPPVPAHQEEGDLGVELAEELPARAARHPELVLELLAVDGDPPEVLVALQKHPTSRLQFGTIHKGRPH